MKKTSILATASWLKNNFVEKNVHQFNEYHVTLCNKNAFVIAKGKIRIKKRVKKKINKNGMCCTSLSFQWLFI